MEKIYLRPNPQEILIKGTADEGALDAFAYAGDSNGAARHLGALHVVGNVQYKTDDMAYATNLIAALAKREYYADPSMPPKDAFAAMLRKANEVVEEFFKHDGLTINLGIFAIAGDKISISKLGKFKILMARDGKTIDVLNNIQLFGKEQATQTQFSSVITGNVHESDRIFAFYPARAVVTRERSIKENLPKLASAEFIQKLQDIHTQKNTFSCAAVYVDFQKIREIPSESSPQPQELASPAPVSRPVLAASSEGGAPGNPDQASPVPAGHKVTPVMPRVQPVQATKVAQEVPRIIPSEFLRGKKDTMFSSLMDKLRLIRFTPQVRAVLTLTVIAVIVGGVLVIQSSSLLNPEAKAVDQAVSEARTQLELAKTRISQNDLAHARTILTSSILALQSLSYKDNEKVALAQQEMTSTLDGIDQAQLAKLSLVFQVPVQLPSPSLIGAAEQFFAVYGQATASGSLPYLAVLAEGQVNAKDDVTGVSADILFKDGAPTLALDRTAGTYFVQNNGKARTHRIDTTAPISAAAYYQDNLYLVTGTQIIKIPDASQGAAGGQPWLQKGVSLAGDPLLMAVDGNLYVLSKTGLLTTYYRGEKVREANTSITPSAQSRLLTTDTEAANLYLVDAGANRIYVIDKRTGTLAKTLTFDAPLAIKDAAIRGGTTLFILSGDGKVWQVE